jgi:propionate CoA-transferase
MRNKVTTAAQAASLVQSGDTLSTSGISGVCVPHELLRALGERFVETGEPRDLTLFYGAGQGDTKGMGLDLIGHEGLIKRVIAGHVGLTPKLVRLANQNKIEAYLLPQGVISHLYRDIAAGKPGTISRAGIGTFVDPRIDGGKVNQAAMDAKADLVRLMDIDGEEWLFYKARPINVVFVRATSADPQGNVCAEREALVLDSLAMAMAAKNSGGIVVVQVERIVASGSLNPRHVLIPSALVDCVVIARPENHWQTNATAYNAAFSGEIKLPTDGVPTMALDERKVIARRCAMELRSNAIVNLGVGIPDGVAAVAAEERIAEYLTLTVEGGSFGGVPAAGGDFGASVNADAIVHQNQMFDFYDGGGLDITFLGMAEADAEGNVNVSRFGPRLTGPGGFINISQNARKVVFAGTFSAGGLELKVADGKLQIVKEGKNAKLCTKVEHITFAGKVAAAAGKQVLYVTERCVFELTREGLELIEIAPGIDLEKDILARMPFRPIMKNVRSMDPAIFRPQAMDLKRRMLDLSLEDRVAYDAGRDILFLNFEGLQLHSSEAIEALRAVVIAQCELIGHRVPVVINYDAFSLAPDLEPAFAESVRLMEEKYYTRVSRFTTSAFMRLKLTQVLTRSVRPHLFESASDAQTFHDVRP